MTFRSGSPRWEASHSVDTRGSGSRALMARPPTVMRPVPGRSVARPPTVMRPVPGRSVARPPTVMRPVPGRSSAASGGGQQGVRADSVVVERLLPAEVGLHRGPAALVGLLNHVVELADRVAGAGLDRPARRAP